MWTYIAAAILGFAFIAPVLAFSQRVSRDVAAASAALAAIAIGWGLNVAWALAADRSDAAGAQSPQGKNVRIAARFGWVCPVVLVGAAAAIRHLNGNA